MKAEERNIGGVLTEQLRYEIPPYQRPYSWGIEETKDLLSDIAEAFEAMDREYFIGSLITIAHDSDRFEVVDGQQRLTTLNIIFARLREAISDADAKQEMGKRILPRNPLTGDTESPRLTLRKSDQKFFRDHILSARPVDKSTAAQLDTPKARLLANAKAVDTFLADRSQEWIKLFANYVLQKVFVVVVKTENFQSAYRLFNVLNARGVGLSNADLIKNRLFARLDVAREGGRDELEDLWVELEETTDVDNLDTFLGYHRTTVRADKAKKSLAEEFQSIIAEDSGSPAQFLGSLIASAKNYDKITSNELTDANAARPLAALGRVTYDEWIPALLAYLNKPVSGLPEAEFVSLLEKITMQNWVRRLGRTARNTIYYRLITAINRGADASDVRTVFSESANNEEFFSLLDGDLYGLPSARSVLLRLEEASQDDSVTKKFGGAISIEHVLPQALKDEYWSARFTEGDHRRLVHKLGNLTLLSGTKNSSAQYYAFPRKKAVYLKKNQKVSFDLTKEICAQDNWEVSNVEFRQAQLLALAKQLWQIA